MTSLSEPERRILNWLKRAPCVSLKGRHFWRCIESKYLPTILESGVNFHRATRYSVAGQFSAIYFSENRILAGREKTQGQDENFFEPVETVKFRFGANASVPDLTDKEAQISLEEAAGISYGDLTATGLDRFARTQPIGRAAYGAGLAGLMVPSAQPGQGDGWRNLVLYPAHILASWLVKD